MNVITIITSGELKSRAMYRIDNPAVAGKPGERRITLRILSSANLSVREGRLVDHLVIGSLSDVEVLSSVVVA